MHSRVRQIISRDKWAIGVVKEPIHRFLDPAFVPDIKWIGHSNRLSFVADCFGVADGSRRFVLAERFSHRGWSEISPVQRNVRTGRGRIICLELDSNGCVTSESSFADSGSHISYPFTVFDDGSWFAVAEEISRNVLNLYRILPNCASWTLVRQLLPFGVIDPTIVAANGAWWLFGATRKRPNDELHIWCADHLAGPWRPHPLNPVSVLEGRTRPGGTPFFFEGQLYRPAQQSAKTYGESILLYRIDALTRTSYAETLVRQIRSPLGSPYRHGVHTLSSFGDWTLLDAKTSVALPGVAIRSFLFSRLLCKYRSLRSPKSKGGGKPL